MNGLTLGALFTVLIMTLLLGGLGEAGTTKILNPTPLVSQEGWEILPAMPEVRSDFSSAVIGTKIFLFGGLGKAQDMRRSLVKPGFSISSGL